MMKVYIDKKLYHGHTIVYMEHRGFVISSFIEGDGPAETVIFPDNHKEIERSYEIPLLSETFHSVPDATDAVNKLADMIAMGLIKFKQ